MVETGGTGRPDLRADLRANRRANLRTGLRRARGRGGMATFDGLPAPLRAWLREAALPWSAASVRRIWAAARGRDRTAQAVQRLARLEAALLARDAARVWGPGHPGCGGEGEAGAAEGAAPGDLRPE